MRKVGETSWAVTIGRPDHVVLVVVDGLGFVVARWEVDIRTKRRSITVAVLVRETYTCSCISWVLNTDSMETIRVDRVQWFVGVGAGAGPLHWLRSTAVVVENGFTTSGGRRAKVGVTNNHAVARLESLDLVGGSLEAVMKLVSFA